MYSIKKTDIDAFFSALSAQGPLYLPQKAGSKGDAEFLSYRKGAKYSTILNTVRSAKDFFFPQMETLASFKTEGKKIEIIDERKEDADFVLFGVRACDVASFNILDSVFLADPIDTYYENRRRHATIISMACNEPASTCFCTLYGIDPAHAGADIQGWMDEDHFYFEPLTERGKALMAKHAALFDEGGDESVDALCKEVTAKMEKLPFTHLDMSAFKGENLMNLFERKEWDELSSACLGCGTCTFVCPTCQCFDIRDFDGGHKVQRYRCWDSCMYSEFTKMAAANPRLTQKERFRQRFMHKLVYGPQNHDGVFGCVGCGRCLQRCPIHMHIVKVIKTLGEEK